MPDVEDAIVIERGASGVTGTGTHASESDLGSDRRAPVKTRAQIVCRFLESFDKFVHAVFGVSAVEPASVERGVKAAAKSIAAPFDAANNLFDLPVVDAHRAPRLCLRADRESEAEAQKSERENHHRRRCLS